MVFVNITFLWGALLIAVPVLIHLLLRQKPKKALFPSIRHIPQGRTLYKSRINLRELLLLFLRCLIILFMVAAFAGPAVKKYQDTKKPNAHLIAIDDTLSTGLQNQSGGVLFDDIKLNTLDYIVRQDENDLFLVYTFSSGLHSSGLSKKRCGDIIEGLQIQAGMKDFSKITDSIDYIDRKKYNIYLYIASDFSPRVIKNMAELRRKTKTERVVFYRSRLPESVNNAALTGVEIKGFDAGRVTGTAKVQNRGQSAVRRIFAVSSSGRTLFESAVELMHEEEKTISFSVSSDDSIEEASSCLPLELKITPSDTLPADDIYRAGVVIPDDQKANILLVGKTARGLILLKAALESLSVCSETKKIRYDQMTFANLCLDDILDYDAVVFTSPAKLLLSHKKRVIEYIKSGGGLYFFVDDSVGSEVTERMFEAGIIPTETGKLLTPDKAVYLSDSSREELKNKSGNYDLNLLRFSRMYQISAPLADSVPLRYRTGDVFICSKDTGKGKTVLINTSADGSLSSLSSSPVWPLFCRTLFNLSYNIRSYSFTTDEDIEIFFHNSLSSVAVHNTDSTVSEYNIADGRIIVTPAKKVGWVYCRQPEIYAGVNAHPEETNFSVIDDDQLNRLIAKTFIQSNFGKGNIQKAGQYYKPIPLWKYLLAGAVVLVLFEYLVANIMEK